MPLVPMLLQGAIEYARPGSRDVDWNFEQFVGDVAQLARDNGVIFFLAATVALVLIVRVLSRVR